MDRTGNLLTLSIVTLMLGCAIALTLHGDTALVLIGATLVLLAGYVTYFHIRETRFWNARHNAWLANQPLTLEQERIAYWDSAMAMISNELEFWENALEAARSDAAQVLAYDMTVKWMRHAHNASEMMYAEMEDIARLKNVTTPADLLV